MKQMLEVTRFIFSGFFLILVVLIYVHVPGLLQAMPPHKVPCWDAESKIRINGMIDEEAWQKALKLELNYEVTPGENIKPPVRTEVFLASSKTHFYVGFHAYDPEPSAIRARLTDRDNIFDDDWVCISVDTFSDQRRIYSFYCNPLGIQAEMIETGASENPSWDTIWVSAGQIVEDGYMVEMAIPFGSLRFQRKKEEQMQMWGFDAIRRYPRNLDHHISFIPIDRNNFCYMCQMAKIIGFKGAKAGKNIELDPSVSVLFTQEREDIPVSKWAKKQSKPDPGITAQWGITPGMTLSAAINPDFSHVEADVAQLNINTQYALYYPEKRPFFLEGTSIFNTRLPAIYTRTLADPIWGIKLTGKQGAHALGFYSAQDNITNLVLPGSYWSQSTSLDITTIGTVLRYRRDVGKISTLGILFTGREGDDYYNRLAGVDAYLRLTPKKHVTVQFLASQTHYPLQVASGYEQPGGKLFGTALDLIFRHESRNIGYYVTYKQVTPRFRADLGFMPQVGYRHITAVMIFATWRNPGHWYTFMNATPSFEYESDYNGNLIHISFKLNCKYRGPSESFLTLVGILRKQGFMGNIFNTNHLEVYSGIQASGPLKVWLNGTLGHQVDYANIRSGTRFMLNPGINYKAGRHFSINLDHVFERFNVETGRLYTANVSNLRLIYQFSRRAFLRTIFQYVNYHYNIENYTIPRESEFKHFFTQVLFSYKINPQTMLFLGYSDDSYGNEDIPLTQANHTFFLKIGYALVL